MSAREWRNRMNCYQGMYRRRLATWMASNRNLSDYNGAPPKILGESPQFEPQRRRSCCFAGSWSDPARRYTSTCVECFVFFRPRVNLSNNSTHKHHPSPKSSPALPKVYCLADSSCMAACDASRLCLPVHVCLCVCLIRFYVCCFPCVPVFHAVFLLFFFISKEGGKTKDGRGDVNETRHAYTHART